MRPVFQCKKCMKVFKRSFNYNFHLNNVKCDIKYKCSECKKEYKHPSLLKEHERLHRDAELKCSKCDFTTKRKSDLKRHFKRRHFKETPEDNDPLSTAVAIEDEEEDVSSSNETSPHRLNEETKIEEDIVDETNYTTFSPDFEMDNGIEIDETIHNQISETCLPSNKHKRDVPPPTNVYNSKKLLRGNWAYRTGKPMPYKDDETYDMSSSPDDEMDSGLKLDDPPTAKVQNSKKLLRGNWAYRTGKPTPYKDDETDDMSSSSVDKMDCGLKLDVSPMTKVQNSEKLLMGNRAYRTSIPKLPKPHCEKSEVKKFQKKEKSKKQQTQLKDVGNEKLKLSNEAKETTAAEKGTSELVDLTQDDDDEVQVVYDLQSEALVIIECRAGTNTTYSELSLNKHALCGFFSEDGYLNDEVVNFALQMFLECNAKRQGSRQILIVSSHLFQQRVAGRDKTSIDLHFLDNKTDQMKRSVKRAKSVPKNMNIFAKRMLIFPICYARHWTLAVILNPLRAFGDIEKRSCTILYFDSLKISKTISPNQIKKLMSEWLRREYESSFGSSSSSFNEERLHFFQPNDLEQQENGADCGVFVAYFAKFAMSFSKELLELNERGDIGSFRFVIPPIGRQEPDSRIQLYQEIMRHSDSKRLEIANSFAPKAYKRNIPNSTQPSSNKLHAASNCHSTRDTSFKNLDTTGASSDRACTSNDHQEQNFWITPRLPLGVPQGKEDAWKMIEKVDLEDLLDAGKWVSHQVVFLLILLKVAHYNLNSTTKIGVIPIFYSQWLVEKRKLSEEEKEHMRADIFFGFNRVDQFIMPILSHGHFTVIKFDRTQGNAVHVNSMQYESKEEEKNIIEAIRIFAEVLQLRDAKVENKMFHEQKDSTSCGIFVVAACECWCGQKFPCLSSKWSLIEKRKELQQMLIKAIENKLIVVADVENNIQPISP